MSVQGSAEENSETRLQGYKTFFMLNSTGHVISVIINIEISTAVGILSFISTINKISVCMKPKNTLCFSNYVFVSWIRITKTQTSLRICAFWR